MITNLTSDEKYLSNIMDKLPSNCLLNKGVTGCGGTYVELHSNRDSIILVPTINLAQNKYQDGFLIVYGEVSDRKIKEYLDSNIEYKKIIGTYDCLSRLMKYDVLDYFLLIDEYHLLFNSYSYRNTSIVFVLKNYDKFSNYCFMTATPLRDNTILKEIEHLDIINIKWTKAVPIKLNLIDTYFTVKELISILAQDEVCNYHIFLNSVKTIKYIIDKVKLKNYRVVCSKKNAKIPNFASTKDPVCKYNFYTSSAFEGCDIYDPIGKTIIICDTHLATTILDISTLIVQICGRLRDSIYKDDITVILNTSKHRYTSISRTTFLNNVEENKQYGIKMEEEFIKADPLFKNVLLRGFSEDSHHSMYINCYEDNLYYDSNLVNVDKNNFEVINGIYNNTISVLKEYEKNQIKANVIKSSTSNIYNEIRNSLLNKEYTFTELKDTFIPIFTKYNLSFTSSMLNTYFPSFEKIRKTRNGKKDTYYKFK